MDRNQRSRNQKKSVPPRKGQPSHRNTKSAPPQRNSRPAGSRLIQDVEHNKVIDSSLNAQRRHLYPGLTELARNRPPPHRAAHGLAV